MIEMNNEKVSTSINMDKELHKRVKHYMVDFDITMIALVEKLLEKELKKEGY